MKTATPFEIVFRSWDPPSGAITMHIEVEIGGVWKLVTWGLFDFLTNSDAAKTRTPENRKLVMSSPYLEEDSRLYKRRALKISDESGLRTRVIQTRARI